MLARHGQLLPPDEIFVSRWLTQSDSGDAYSLDIPGSMMGVLEQATDTNSDGFYDIWRLTIARLDDHGFWYNGEDLDGDGLADSVQLHIGADSDPIFEPHSAYGYAQGVPKGQADIVTAYVRLGDIYRTDTWFSYVDLNLDGIVDVRLAFVDGKHTTSSVLQADHWQLVGDSVSRNDYRSRDQDGTIFHFSGESNVWEIREVEEE